MSAGSIYLVNDVLDVEQDRAHPTKRRRPIAAGTVSIRLALTGSAALTLASLGIVSIISLQALAWIIVYLISAHLYTLVAKRIPLLDVILIGSFYSLRVLTGFSAVSLFPVGWYGWAVLAGLLALAVELGRRKTEGRYLVGRARERKALAFYSETKLTGLYASTAVVIIVVYSLIAFSTSVIFGVSVVLVTVGLARYWRAIAQLGRDIHPQEVIFNDRLMVAILIAFSIAFATLYIHFF